jgi:hypothetical protein
MLVGKGTPRKPEKQAEARRLRREEGLPIKRIATLLEVSPSSVHWWTKDIELTGEQRRRNLRGPLGPQNPEAVARRAAAWAEVCRRRRREYQEEGRRCAREGDPTHQAGCMLYWAEGAKARNVLMFANSDVNMVAFFCRFLRHCFHTPDDQFTMRLNVYTGNGISLAAIEEHWLDGLDLPRSCLRGHTLNHKPTSSSGMRRNKLPYGVCAIRILRSTWLVQHILGAIQEYGGFEEPRWVDGPLRRREPRPQ